MVPNNPITCSTLGKPIETWIRKQLQNPKKNSEKRSEERRVGKECVP